MHIDKIPKANWPPWIRENGAMTLRATDDAIEVIVAPQNFFKIVLACHGKGLKLLGAALNINRTQRLVFLTKESLKLDPEKPKPPVKPPAKPEPPTMHRRSRSSAKKDDGEKSDKDGKKGKKGNKKKDKEDPDPESNGD